MHENYTSRNQKKNIENEKGYLYFALHDFLMQFIDFFTVHFSCFTIFLQTFLQSSSTTSYTYFPLAEYTSHVIVKSRTQASHRDHTGEEESSFMCGGGFMTCKLS